MNFSRNLLESKSVDIVKMSSNFPEIFSDCYGLEDATLKSELIRRFPLVEWLLSTTLSSQLRNNVMNGIQNVHKDGDGKWVVELPRSIWTQPFETTQDECCWVLPDFAKCAGNVPLNLLCLKDCNQILDDLIEDTLRVGSRVNVPGIASPNDTIDDIKRRLARLTMAFLTAYNIQLGMDNTSTDILKPFHGVLQLMQNPAVVTIQGTNVLAAFESLACRLAVLGGGNWIIAIHEMGYEALKSVVVPGQNGQLPMGWTRDGDEIRFRGIRFIRDRFMPLDITNGTTEAWVMSGDYVGVYMGTDLAPAERFIRYSGHDEETYANGCASECVYYYNYGAAFNTNAHYLMKIVDIPVNMDCLSAVSDLWNRMKPTTLIPE